MYGRWDGKIPEVYSGAANPGIFLKKLSVRVYGWLQLPSIRQKKLGNHRSR